ncbi:MAG: DMT family transporter [Cyanobacteria bacterium P01_D01_bin.1]
MRLSDVLELLLLAALWGGSFLFMRIAAPVLGPVWLIESRVLLAGLVLLPLVLQAKAWPTARMNLKPLFIVGSINSALPFVLLAFASLALPAGYTSIVNATAPLFGTLIAAVWLRERLTPARMIGLLSGFGGVVLLIGLQPMEISPRVVGSIVAGLLAAIMYAIAAPYAKHHLAGVPPLVIATMTQLGAAVALLPLLPLSVPSTMPSTTIMLAVLALALFSTSLAYLLYFRLLQNIGASKALTVTYLVPVFAMLWGSLFLGEAITAAMILGCCLILLGTAIANGLLFSSRS